MRTSRRIKLIVEKTDTGFSAFCDKYSVYTTGDTFSTLQQNAIEAMNLYFSEQGIKVYESNIKFEVDLKQFFKYYRVINAKFLAKRIGMNETLLSQYITGKKKPSPSQTNRILTGINEIGRELCGIHLFTN